PAQRDGSHRTVRTRVPRPGRAGVLGIRDARMADGTRGVRQDRRGRFQRRRGHRRVAGARHRLVAIPRAAPRAGSGRVTRARALAVTPVLAGAASTGGWLMHRGLATRAPRGTAISEAEGAKLFDAVLRRVENSWVD